MKEFKIYKHPWKALKLILGCSIFVIGGIFILMNDGPDWIGWMCILFFGLGYPVGFFNLFDRRPQIILNELGIFDRTISQDFVNWDIIQNAYVAAVHGQKFICLIVVENFEPSKKKGRWYKTGAAMNKALGFQELNIMLGQVKVDEEKMLAFIIAMIHADTSKREELIKTLPQTGL